MDLDPVRDAYSALSRQYVGLLDDGWPDDAEDTALVRRHLTGLVGPVLDLGCGPGHWTAYLHSLGVAVTGVDQVPEFVAHARSTYPGPDYRLGPMTEPGVAEHSVAGILAWYSTIHLPPTGLDRALIAFRRLLRPAGVLVLGFFDSEDEVAGFDHEVVAAYRWPVDVLSEHLTRAGFAEVERRQHRLPTRPDRRYAALVARASEGGSQAPKETPRPPCRVG